MDKYYKLAQLVKLCAKDISKSSNIAKIENVHYILGLGKSTPVLEVCDDSGHRNILLGDVYGDKGYCYIYVDNADEQGKFMYKCYPSIKEIAERFRKLSAKSTFCVIDDPGNTEDVRAYDSYGVMRTEWLSKKRSIDAINYFADVINLFADKIEADPRAATEIFDASCLRNRKRSL